MGKVGSTSLLRSLKNAKLPYPIYRAHRLSYEGIKEAEDHYLSLQPIIPRHVRLYPILRRKIEEDKTKVNWRIITSVREPISREISDFFENVEVDWPNLIDENGRLETNNTIDFLRNMLINYDESSDYASTWFDKELKTVFNIDVYSYLFNHNDGFTILGERNVKVLILRKEDLDRSFDTAIMRFLDLDKPIRMVRSNVGKDKKYTKEYAYVLENITIPESVCTRFYSSKYARHFYTETMRNEFIQKWSI